MRYKVNPTKQTTAGCQRAIFRPSATRPRAISAGVSSDAARVVRGQMLVAQEHGRDARGVEQPPERVAVPREVVPDRARAQAGVDADEEQARSRDHDVLERRHRNPAVRPRYSGAVSPPASR
jgi:hypothetical protein